MSLTAVELLIDSLIASMILSAVIPMQSYVWPVALFGLFDSASSFLGRLLDAQAAAAGWAAAVILINPTFELGLDLSLLWLDRQARRWR